LHRLWTSGRCARAMIHNRFGQQRASLVMYAMSASDFLEVE
jgi:esterase/lipase superfamily enzyme